MRSSTFALLRASRPAYTPFVTRRTLNASAARLASKEDALHHENRAEEAEHHKQDQLRKQKEGKGHWKQELASNSEEMLKADRDSPPASKEHISKLQEQSQNAAKEKHGQDNPSD